MIIKLNNIKCELSESEYMDLLSSDITANCTKLLNWFFVKATNTAIIEAESFTDLAFLDKYGTVQEITE